MFVQEDFCQAEPDAVAAVMTQLSFKAGIKKWGNRMMCRIVNKITWNSRYTDVSCGFRAYSRDTAMRMTLFGDFTYTQETFINLVAKGAHIVEVPLQVQGVREVGKSRVAGNLWRYGRNCMLIILRAARDVRPLAFFGIRVVCT